MGQQGADPIEIDQGPRRGGPDPGRGEPQRHSPPVNGVALPPDQPTANQAIDQERHGWQSDPDRHGQLRQGQGGRSIEMGQDGGLVETQVATKPVGDDPLPEGLVEDRVGGEEPKGGVTNHRLILLDK